MQLRNTLITFFACACLLITLSAKNSPARFVEVEDVNRIVLNSFTSATTSEGHLPWVSNFFDNSPSVFTSRNSLIDRNKENCCQIIKRIKYYFKHTQPVYSNEQPPIYIENRAILI